MRATNGTSVCRGYLPSLKVRQRVISPIDLSLIVLPVHTGNLGNGRQWLGSGKEFYRQCCNFPNTEMGFMAGAGYVSILSFFVQTCKLYFRLILYLCLPEYLALHSVSEQDRPTHQREEIKAKEALFTTLFSSGISSFSKPPVLSFGVTNTTAAVQHAPICIKPNAKSLCRAACGSTSRSG